MPKYLHELRDPVHGFVQIDTDERRIVDSWPLQRLRHIHQLALSYLVYPGVTHRRFEHSLGVMELAGRVYDVVTRPDALTDEVRGLLPREIGNPGFHEYWRRVVRIAALCHDIGHPPFSHAAEKALLPSGWSHERMTAELVLAEPIRSLLSAMTPPVRPDDVVKLAVGPEKAAAGTTFSNWEALLAEIIVDDAFGVDRMDYLLRDSLHAGVVYGRFDHFRLIDTMRILPAPGPGPNEPTLGVEWGGLKSAEALLLARYFMYSQVYFHPVRMAYDLHLIDFLRASLPNGVLPTDVGDHLRLTDNEVLVAMVVAANDSSKPGHEPAKAIIERNHFKVLYERNPTDLEVNPDAVALVAAAASQAIGSDAIKTQRVVDTGGSVDFPVLMKDGRVASSKVMSEPLSRLPAIAVDYVFVAPEARQQAEEWLAANRAELIRPMEVSDGSA
jgi:HD superfamily phosphohydrolase